MSCELSSYGLRSTTRARSPSSRPPFWASGDTRDRACKGRPIRGVASDQRVLTARSGDRRDCQGLLDLNTAGGTTWALFAARHSTGRPG